MDLTQFSDVIGPGPYRIEYVGTNAAEMLNADNVVIVRVERATNLAIVGMNPKNLERFCKLINRANVHLKKEALPWYKRIFKKGFKH